MENRFLLKQMICVLCALFWMSALGCSDSTAGSSDESPEESQEDGLSSGRNGEVPLGGEGTESSTPIAELILPIQDDFGKPCDSNEECLSGFCVESPDGFICTQTCLENCPKGFQCKAVSNLGPDTVFICIPDASLSPCEGKANGAFCEDGSPCTEEETCLDGECIGGVSVTCDDGNSCTGAKCDFKYGCQFEPIEGDCEDNDVCTVGGSCEEGSCIGGEVLICDDGDVCTQDICDPLEGCVHPEENCDDGNPGTLDICLEDGCNNIDACSGLVGAAALCYLEGKKGDVVPCDLKMLSTKEGVDTASSLQLKVVYASPLVMLSYLSACPTCEQGIAAGMNISSGHLLSYNPSNPADWEGEGEILLLSLSNPYPITTAYASGDEITGIASYLTLHFELLQDLDTPIPVLASSVVVGNGDGAPMKYSVVDSKIITDAYGVGCETNGQPCDDGNACTLEDQCVAKVCAGEVRLCDDGNICSFDFCDPATGCYHQSVEDDCPCHDGSVCTESGSCVSGICEVTSFEGCE